MARDWEQQLRTWAKPASQTEEEKRKRTERAITDAINAVPRVKDLPIHVYAKGSYANRTNVRSDSDVDVNVEYTGIEYYDWDEAPASAQKPGPATHEYAPEQLRNDVLNALVSAFGQSAVTDGNKAISLQERSNQLAADVVPCFSYRRYYDRYGSLASYKGTIIFPKSGWPIHNWPQQHYDNGVTKNDQHHTAGRFKDLVRILKNLENEMEENGAAAEVPSYLIECLVWNVPDNAFGHADYLGDLRSVLVYLFNNTLAQDKCQDFAEINDLKWLFRGRQKWTWQEAHAFAGSAWDYVGFD